ncbi:MAG TPA: PDZ domain-containing protein, partial [Chitinophagaceae bacterium]|nr:PDZ domain-containing protein [Chitinophagaceae bacterium]
MKKIILLAFVWPLISYPVLAQKEKKEKISNDGQEIIIIKHGDKEKKLTIETKDGEVFINGKPSSEYKDGDVSVIKQKFRSDRNFLYTPQGGNFKVFNRAYNGFLGNNGFLGVTTEKTDAGVKITEIAKGSAAEKAGLKEGDIITKIGDKKVSDPDDVMDVIS